MNREWFFFQLVWRSHVPGTVAYNGRKGCADCAVPTEPNVIRLAFDFKLCDPKVLGVWGVGDSKVGHVISSRDPW